MASSKPFNAVMHASATEFQAILALAIRLINNGLYINTTLFPAPPVPLAGTTGFQAAVTKLGNLIGLAKGNSNNVTLRDEQAVLVHNMLLQLIAYCNPICNHVLANITLSGFDASNVPVPTVKPNMPVIKKITEEKQTAGYYKVFLTRNKKKTLVTAQPAMQHKGTRYTLKSGVTATGPWTTHLEGVASTKLVFSGLVTGNNFIIIYGVNSAGQGATCAPFPFTPQVHNSGITSGTEPTA